MVEEKGLKYIIYHYTAYLTLCCMYKKKEIMGERKDSYSSFPYCSIQYAWKKEKLK